MIHNGTPGGCAIPRTRATTISSPLSVRVTVGARSSYKEGVRPKDEPAQNSSLGKKELYRHLFAYPTFDACARSARSAELYL
jgi:hypothetical protein